MAADDIPNPAIGKQGEEEDPFRRVRLEKLATLRGMGVDPYPVSFARANEAAELETLHAALPAGAETEEQVRVAGRVRAIRNSGMVIDPQYAFGKNPIYG